MLFFVSGRTAHVALAVLLALTPAAADAAPGKPERFALPLNAAGAHAKTSRCAAEPYPVVGLDTAQMYRSGDESYSVIDPSKQQARARRLAPIRGFTAGLARYANAYARSGGRDVDSGTCALKWMRSWAAADAMTRMTSPDAQFVRTVNLSGWALSYLQLTKLAHTDTATKRIIDHWLADMASDTIRFNDTLEDETSRNNHRYWAGLAVAAIGVGTSSSKLVSWGISSAKIGLDQITAKGILPLEAKRANRARQYHLYACAPLVLIAELGLIYKINLYEYHDGALHRLVHLALDSLNRPEILERASGANQEPNIIGNGHFNTQILAWVEIYDRRFPASVTKVEELLSAGHLSNAEIGGDMSIVAGNLKVLQDRPGVSR